MALRFDFKFTERLYLSNVSQNGVVSSSAVYSEAPLILSSFCEGRAQQITASGVIAMKKCACLNSESKYEGGIP